MRFGIYLLTLSTFWLASVPAQMAAPGVEPPAAPNLPSRGDSTPTPGLPFRPGAKASYNSVRVNQPVVAMTFDDGPHGTFTPRLLDLLKARKVRATFFVLGENVVAHPDITRRILAEGHEIANHSWSHPSLTKLSLDAVRSQMVRTQDAVAEVTGRRPTLMRPPYGATSERLRSWMHGELGLTTVMWSVDPLDWKRPGPSVVAQRIVTGAAPGAIILAHDIHGPTIDAMPAAIDGLVGRGFRFVTCSELFAMEQPAPPPTPAASPAPSAAPSAARE